MKKLKSVECLIETVSALPLAALALCLRQLPQAVPPHWNLADEVDCYGSPVELLCVCALSLNHKASKNNA